ncbi:MAG: sulfur transferase domain-containing protein [Phormidesmis sp.]
MDHNPVNDDGAVIQPVGEQISVSSQLSPAQLRQLPEQGFKSVVNLRNYQEENATADDHQLVESLGLSYVNLPIKPDKLDEVRIEQVLGQVHELPKPLLIYCGSSLRATFIALL